MTQMNNLKEALKGDLASLTTMRDELRLQLQLAKADARDDWQALETKWQQVENELSQMGDHAKEPIKEIGEAARTLIDELKNGYARIKSQLEH